MNFKDGIKRYLSIDKLETIESFKIGIAHFRESSLYVSMSTTSLTLSFLSDLFDFLFSDLVTCKLLVTPKSPLVFKGKKF